MGSSVSGYVLWVYVPGLRYHRIICARIFRLQLSCRESHELSIHKQHMLYGGACSVAMLANLLRRCLLCSNAHYSATCHPSSRMTSMQLYLFGEFEFKFEVVIPGVHLDLLHTLLAMTRKNC